MTPDEAQYYLDAHLNNTAVEVKPETLNEAICVILKRNDVLEKTLTEAYAAMDKAQGMLGRRL